MRNRRAQIAETSPKSLSWATQIIKGQPNHDHNHFWVHLAEPHFFIFGVPLDDAPNATSTPFYTVEYTENAKIFHLMCHQMPFWCGIRCKTFLENYGRDFPFRQECFFIKMWKRQFWGIFGIFWDMALFPWNSLVTMKCQIICATPPPWEPCQASEAYGQMKETFSWDMEWPYFGKHARTIPFERTLVMSQKSLPNTLRDPSSGRGGSGPPSWCKTLRDKPHHIMKGDWVRMSWMPWGFVRCLFPHVKIILSVSLLDFGIHFSQAPRVNFSRVASFLEKRHRARFSREFSCLEMPRVNFIGEHLHPPDLLLCVSVTCKNQSVWPNL